MPLLTVPDAIALVLRETAPLPPGPAPLDSCLGLTLAEAVVSDIDSPPFDKALMDGYAVRAADVSTTGVVLRVIEEVTAGRVPTKTVREGDATRIMTGAPIPMGADAVVRIEDTHLEVDGSVRINAAVKQGASILPRATTVSVGQTVLHAGRLLRPQDLGALAELGVARVAVRRRPVVGVLATGDELVSVDVQPGPGQIRNSNETMLTAQIHAAGGIPLPLGVARDDRAELGRKIRESLTCDVLLLTGGVSAGLLDLVPSELAAAGVRQVFHKVDVKPGKPVWFGVFEGGGVRSQESGDRSEASEGRTKRCLVFGLPGNPVSSLVCFELFARPALRRLMGAEPAEPSPVRARLEQPHIARGDRPTYHPARLRWTESGPTVATVRWHGSSDLCGTLEANAMALFPAGDRTYDSGEVVLVHCW